MLHRNRPFCVCEPSLGDLGATHGDHLRLIRKRVVEFLLATEHAVIKLMHAQLLTMNCEIFSCAVAEPCQSRSENWTVAIHAS